jgi:hypothetical protein
MKLSKQMKILLVNQSFGYLKRLVAENLLIIW